MIPRSLPPIAVLLQKEEPTSQEADFLILSVLDFGSLGAGSQLLEWIFGTAATAEEKGQKCERASHLSWGLAYDDDACLELMVFELSRRVGRIWAFEFLCLQFPKLKALHSRC